jgi:hypothetical protein
VHTVCIDATNVPGNSYTSLGCRTVDNPVVNAAFRALPPARLLDTRNGTGAPAQAIGPGQTVDLQVTGRGGVPASGVGAVVLNVTATEATTTSYLTVFPTATSRPLASNLNVGPRENVANLVIAKVGAGGKVSVYNAAGSTHVIADVAGWYSDGAPSAADGRFHAVTPSRALDTRADPGQPIGPGETLWMRVSGPSGAVKAVVLNLTATDPTSGTYLTVYPQGTARPNASNLNIAPGQTRPNAVIAALSPDGVFGIYNDSGSTHVIADFAGWFDADPTGWDSSAYNPLSPSRVLDTRTGNGAAGPVGPGGTIKVKLSGRGGVPEGARSVVLNVTVTEPTAPSYLTVWPSSADRPLASNLNFVREQTVPNLVTVPLSPDGFASFFNANGSTHVVADVAGYYR